MKKVAAMLFPVPSLLKQQNCGMIFYINKGLTRKYNVEQNRTEQNRTEQNRTEQNSKIVRHAEALIIATHVIANDSEAICSVNGKHKGRCFGASNLFKRLLRSVSFMQARKQTTRSDVKHGGFFSPFTFHLSPSFAFTLSEVIITLGIIGVVAAISIPALLNNIQDAQYKTAYKKAYSDISTAFTQAIKDQDLLPRTGTYENNATESEWAVIKSAFSVTKDCTAAQLNNCWVDADRVCIGCGGGPGRPAVGSKSFIDLSGRAWSMYSNTENIYLVDVNGSKEPNKFGKDRWMFTLKNADNTRVTSGFPAKVGIYRTDITTAGSWCQYAPCYYYSWLYN